MTNSAHAKPCASAVLATAALWLCLAPGSAVAQTATSGGVAGTQSATTSASAPTATVSGGASKLTILKKKKKLLAAQPAPTAADQPPVALDTSQSVDTGSASQTAPGADTGQVPKATADAAPDPGPDSGKAIVKNLKKPKTAALKPGAASAAAAGPASDAATKPDLAKVDPKKVKHKTVANAPGVADAKPMPNDGDTATAGAAATTAKAKSTVVAKSSTVAADPAAAGSGKKSLRKTASLTAPGGPLPASGCRTRSFLVNDYGKDGPASDAKRLLDKDIADWAKSNALTGIKVGAKSVKCEQFLNFIVFDEWTCTASAKVCWQ